MIATSDTRSCKCKFIVIEIKHNLEFIAWIALVTFQVLNSPVKWLLFRAMCMDKNIFTTAEKAIGQYTSDYSLKTLKLEVIPNC